MLNYIFNLFHHFAEVMKLQYEKVCRLEKVYTKLQMTIEEIRQLLLNRTEVLHHPNTRSQICPSQHLKMLKLLKIL